MKTKRRKYSSDLPRLMYLFFVGYSECGLPSYRKFAESVGLTLAELEGFRVHKDFERAYRECGEIRRDYLIDNALTRRFDPSFSKFLISAEYGETEEKDTNLDVKLEVVGE